MPQLFKIIDIFYTLRVFYKQIIAVSVFRTCSQKNQHDEEQTVRKVSKTLPLAESGLPLQRLFWGVYL